MTLRTLLGVVAASGVALGLIVVGCNGTGSPTPTPGADGGSLGGPNFLDAHGTPDDTGAYQDAPHTVPMDAPNNGTSDASPF